MRRPEHLTWLASATVATVVGLAVSTDAQKKLELASIDLVELDVVVADRSGHAVLDLKKEDFEVKENGRIVELKTFGVASASGSTELDEGRSVVVLLDDVNTAPAATNSIKSIAAYFVTKSGPGDDVSVVRLSNRADEPYGDFRLALTRISEYQSGIVPYDPLRSTEDVLKLVASVSRRLEANGRRRKAIVCIGSQRICNIAEPIRHAPGSIWKDWVDALTATARANVSVYALTAGRGRFPGGGLVDATGGEVFGSHSDLRPSMDRIWADSSHHYLLGYWPGTTFKELHSIDVKVRRRGAHVLARKWRGN